MRVWHKPAGNVQSRHRGKHFPGYATELAFFTKKTVGISGRPAWISNGTVMLHGALLPNYPGTLNRGMHLISAECRQYSN